MKYDKHGVKEEDFGTIYPELCKEWSETESEEETLKLEKHQNGHNLYLHCGIVIFFYWFFLSWLEWNLSLVCTVSVLAK